MSIILYLTHLHSKCLSAPAAKLLFSYSLCVVAEFAFTSTSYTVVEDEGSATVGVSLISGTLDRSVVVTLTPSSLEALGTHN